MSCLIIITGSSGFIGKYLGKKILDNEQMILNLKYVPGNIFEETQKIFILGIDLLEDKIKWKTSTEENEIQCENAENDNTKNENKHENNKRLGYTHIQADLSDENNNELIENKINEIIKTESIKSNNIHVFHLAAKISVEESMKTPINYYKNNFMSTLNILEIMRKTKINNIFFSSTAAVYDTTNNVNIPFNSDSAICPSNVYGYTKYMAEELIKSYVKLYGMSAVVFRFFNVAGGKDTAKPHHLIPILIQNIIDTKPWKVFGSKYKTKDGTCVRDYVHVDDISDAFILGMCKMGYVKYPMDKWTILNLGSKTGYTVLEIINKVRKILFETYPDNEIPQTLFCDNREGDPDSLIADITEAHELLGWKPYKTIEDIIINTMIEYDL